MRTTLLVVLVSAFLITGLQALWSSDVVLALVVTLFALFAPYLKTIGLALVHFGLADPRLLPALTLLGNEISFIAGVSVLGFALYAIRPVVHSWMMDLTPSHLGGSATSLMFGAQTGLSILAPVIGGTINAVSELYYYRTM